MDFRHIQQFVVLAETLNFRRTAEKLHMAQPPLSVSIRKLEQELGVALFDRGKDGVKLTKSGEAALEEAQKALFHANQFKLAALAASTGVGGRLRIGFVGSATHEVLPKLIARFRRAFAGIELDLREATSIRIMDELEQEQMDVGVVRIPVASGSGIRLTTLQTETFVLAVARSHPLADEANVKLKDLAEEEFILYAGSDAPGLRMAALHACQLRGFMPKVVQEAIQVQTVLSLVEANMGVALVPSISKRFVSRSVVYKTLIDFPASASIGISLAWKESTQSQAVRNFIEVANQTFRQKA